MLIKIYKTIIFSLNHSKTNRNFAHPIYKNIKLFVSLLINKYQLTFINKITQKNKVD